MGGFAGQVFFRGQAYQRSGFSGVRFVRIQVLRWGQVLQLSDFLRLGVSGVWFYRFLGLQWSDGQQVRFIRVRFFRGQYFKRSGFFKGGIFQGSGFS